MFKCSECDYQQQKKFFKCVECGTFEPPIEINDLKSISLSNKKINTKKLNNKKEFIRNGDKIDDDKLKLSYLDTGISGFNELLGGTKKGIVESSFTLLAGKPGIGKSTLLLQIINNISKTKKSAYISNEESIKQIQMRSQRLNTINDFVIENESNINNIINNFMDYDFLIIDSINTINSGDEKTISGGVKSIKENVLILMEFAKKHNKTIILIGHITKDDTIAGPKQLEHMVDTTLVFDFFDDQEIYRYIKPTKNRFAKIENSVIFEMDKTGLKEIKNPSLLFVSENNNLSGTAISLIIDSSKPIFLEIQALLVETKSEKTIVQSIGIDLKRIFQITAIIQKYLKVNMYDKNLFINILGGFNIKKPYLDLAIVAAILSNEYNKPINDLLFFGELGLTGEIRPTPNEKNLIMNGKKFGYKNIISNSTGYKHIKDIINIFK